MDSTSRNWDSTRWQFDTIWWNCWTVHDDNINKIIWILGINKSKLGQYKTIFGQYKSNYRTTKENVSRKSGDFFGQYMMKFLAYEVEMWVCTSWNWDSTRQKWSNYWDITIQFLDSTSWYWDSTRRRVNKIRWNFWTVHDDFFNKVSWVLAMYKLNLGQYKTNFGQYKWNIE